MIQTVSAVPVEHTLHISNEQSSLVVGKNHTNPLVDARIFYNEQGFYVPSALFYYEDRVRITLTLRAPYETHYVLVKGLLEFHRLKDFLFTFNRNERTIDVGIHKKDIKKLHEFLFQVSLWLDKEIQFKSVLKDILKFERVYKEKMKEVYSLQRAVTAL